MPIFSETVQAYLDRRTINAALLVFFDFRDSPVRLWQGFGTLTSGGHDWQGSGELVGISGLEAAPGMTAGATTFTLSGVDRTIVTMAKAASDRVTGRECTVYIQFFEVAGNERGMQVGALLDSPTAIWTGEMDQISYEASGPSSRTITLTAENIWARRNRPPYGYYTDADQTARYPGDRGLEEIAGLASRQIRFNPRT